MSALELKIPPAIVALLVALIMWGGSLAVPSVTTTLPVRVLASSVFVVLGILVIMAGGVAFRRAHTTVNPMRPCTSSSLVVSGVYRLTRNPMYVGMALALVGWAAFLMNAVSLALVALFVWYMNRFQIAPEERCLHDLFGPEYDSYRARVRRWL